MQHELALNVSPENLSMLGMRPDLPHPDLNLAGSQGVPAPAEIAHPPLQIGSNPPTFSMPDTSVPTLTPHNLAEPAIDLYTPFEKDPMLPDLTQYAQPIGLDIQAEQGIEQTDSALPDFQHPDLSQQVSMQERPGDLAAAAIQLLHQDLTYQSIEYKTYDTVFMDQNGMNDTRTRHMDLLMSGLNKEEN